MLYAPDPTPDVQQQVPDKQLPHNAKAPRRVPSVNFSPDYLRCVVWTATVGMAVVGTYRAEPR